MICLVAAARATCGGARGSPAARAFSRQFSAGPSARFPQSVEWLINTGLENDKASAIALELKKAGVGNDDKSMVGILKELNKDGLKALLASVDASLKEAATRSKLKDATVEVDVPLERYTFTLKGKQGESLYDLTQQDTEIRNYLECACGGQMMCSTCHVYVDESIFPQLDPPERAELDMLDLAWEVRDNSRLGCQLKLREDLPLRITIPEQSNNFFN
mmetsp:Transcript_22447/g.39772  ORF Transcript_22447/g.39772 Transcript_22447/m.39772 type:complete len:218 (+) Transcript_22447:153-806(+)